MQPLFFIKRRTSDVPRASKALDNNALNEILGEVTEEYVEFRSPRGDIVRLNRMRETFVMIKDGQPLPVPYGAGRSIVHHVSGVVFLGPEFELDLKVEEVTVFPVEGKFVKIPFQERGSSDVRHVHMAVDLDVEILPMKIFFFSNYKIGMLPKTLDPRSSFILESRMDRDAVIRLRTIYPQARFVIYGHEKITFVKGGSGVGAKADAGHHHVRATDLMAEAKDPDSLTKNPTFLARLYLRELEWNKMRDLPYKILLLPDDYKNIEAFLQVMLKNERKVPELEDNRPNVQALKEFYSLLASVMSLSAAALVEFNKETIPPVYRPAVVKVITSQKDLSKENKEHLKILLALSEKLAV